MRPWTRNGLIAITVVTVLGWIGCVPYWRANSARDRVRPGMSVEQVLTASQGFSVANLRPDPLRDDVLTLNIYHGNGPGYAAVVGDTRQSLRNAGEAAEIITRYTETHGRGRWKLAMHYFIAPRRTYIIVALDEAGNAVSVTQLMFAD